MLFVKANNLAGAFLYSVDLDDFLGDQCKQGLFPLMSTIKNELTNKVKPDPRKNLIRLLLKSNSTKNHYFLNYFKIFLMIFHYMSIFM